jgi:LuxR family maltose regulon positive regulatory protein
MALASVRLAEQDFAGVLDVLAPVLDGEARVIHEFTTVQALMLAAQAWVELTDRRASEAAVERALELSERDRLVLPFVMAGGTELLERHPRHSTAHAQLLTEILEIVAGGAAPLETDTIPLTEPLSPGELRVLGHLPSNLSVPEIARELFLSVNTVKTHTRHIFAKLDAHNRTEAVERARELGLLGRRPR